MPEVLRYTSEKPASLEHLSSFTQVCDFGRRVVSVAHKVNKDGDGIYSKLITHPEEYKNELMSIASGTGKKEDTSSLSPIINRHIDIFLDTATKVASFRSKFADNQQALFQQTFGYEPQAPDDLDIYYRPTGIYFMVGDQDFDRLYGKTSAINGFVRGDESFTQVKELHNRVGVIRSKQKGKITISDTIHHEERHLLFLQHLKPTNSITSEDIVVLFHSPDDLGKQREMLDDIKAIIRSRAIMEYAAYGGVDRDFNTCPEQTSRDSWSYYFSSLGRGLVKNNISNTAPIRELWLGAYKEYLQEEDFVNQLTRYMMQDVAVIKPPCNFSAGENIAKDKKPRSNLPKDVAEIVFTIMATHTPDRLLQGLGFSSREEFLSHVYDTNIMVIPEGGFFDGPAPFGIRTLSIKESDSQRKEGHVKEIELPSLFSRNYNYEPPSSGPLGQYLDYVWKEGRYALVLDSQELASKVAPDLEVNVTCNEVLYLGEPLSSNGEPPMLKDGDIFLDLHLGDVESLTANDRRGGILFPSRLSQCGVVADILEKRKDITTVTAATNAKLANILVKRFGFIQVDTLPEGRMTESIRRDAYRYDPGLREEIEHKPCPVVVATAKDFVDRFRHL